MMAEFSIDLAELGISPQLFSEDDLPNVTFQQDEPQPTTIQHQTQVVAPQVSIKPENVAVRAPVFRMDSIDKITSMENWMEMSSDMSEFMELGAIDEVRPEAINSLLDTVMEECGIKDRVDLLEKEKEDKGQSDMEQTQSLIDAVEEYLTNFDGQPTVIEDSRPTVIQGNPNFEGPSVKSPGAILPDVIPAEAPAIEVPTVVPEVARQQPVAAQNTDAVLNALMSGQVSLKPEVTEADLGNAITTRLVTETGENVVIIIAPSSPANSDASFAVPQMSPVPSVSPGPSSVYTSDGDSSDYLETDPEWSPAPTKVSAKSSRLSTEEKPRRKYQRKRPLQPPTGPYPCDKKERKKAQNRSAAFRYREKKKLEQDAVDNEVEELEAKNVALKEKLGDLENEMRYLKKLMIEAGLGKYAAAAKT